MNINNRITGPTDFPPAVLNAVSQPIISHRSEQFKNIFSSACQRIMQLLNTKNEPMFFTASGTGGLEATLLNVLSPNSRVLSLSCGYYGDLWATIAKQHIKENLVTEKFPPGKSIDPEKLKDILKTNQFDAILITHTESSTGILNPLSQLTQIIKENSDALILVDAISSVGTTMFNMDAWHIDVAITVPQKALMAPPGLTIICASQRALKIAKQPNRISSFYFDFTRSLAAKMHNQTPSTPNVLGVIGIEAALRLIEKESIKTVFTRHQQLANICQQGVLSTGLTLFADKAFCSPGITAVQLPPSMSATMVQKNLEKDYGLLVTTGLSDWSERVIRIGHMGWVSEEDIHRAIQALSQLMRLS